MSTEDQLLIDYARAVRKLQALQREEQAAQQEVARLGVRLDELENEGDQAPEG